MLVKKWYWCKIFKVFISIYCLFYFKNIEWCLILECSGYMFGLECLWICGNCRDWEECDYLNGSCLYGCNKGIMGINCDIGMIII